MDIFERIAAFYAAFEGEKRILGRSEEGRELFAVKIGSGAPVGISQYAIHGREHIVARLALLHATRPVRGSVWLVPLANPDGALLSEKGMISAPLWRRKRLLALNGGEDFSLWKANIEGVDLNVNFDAHWGEGTSNVFSPAPENYVGKSPLCAAESRALAAFTEQIRPDYTVSWHTKGEEIYWRFFQSEDAKKRDEALARVLSKSTGYPLREAAGSVGGYKDWCIGKLKIPAFTVEAGRNAASHPLGEGELNDIEKHCKDALTALSEAI